MQKGIKFRIYPNREQQSLINQTLGCCRLIYNRGLAMRNEAFGNGRKIGYSQTSAMLTELKKSDDFAFLKVVDSIALQQSLRDLDRGFVNFFQKRAAHPTFKSKHNRHQSYRTINQGDNIRIVGRYIKLPKLGFVKIRQSMEVGKINNVTIEHTPTGKYFAVVNVEFEPQPRQNNGGRIGNKQRVKVALVHEKITNQRNDFLQKQSTMLIRENQTICIEELKVKNMMRNHKLAQHISSVSWSKFFDMLAYKSVWYGNDIIKVPTMYPSSQTCSCCGYKNPLVKNLAIRVWECPDCHTIHNRDTNASVNILNKGLQMQST